AELGKGVLRDLLDEDVEDAPTGQPDGICVVVADAVALEHGVAGLDDLLPELVDGALDAAAGHRPDGLAARSDEHRGSRLATSRPRSRRRPSPPRTTTA